MLVNAHDNACDNPGFFLQPGILTLVTDFLQQAA